MMESLGGRGRAVAFLAAVALIGAVVLVGASPTGRPAAGGAVAGGAVAGGALARGAVARGAADRDVALTPPMGWDTWNTFGCAIDERLIEQTADAMVSSGMRDAGYRYVIVDDCWFDPARDSAGNLQADPSRFPDGMRALGDYLHARGLKFGLYEAPGDKTCAQYAGTYPGSTGSRGHEIQDAREFAAWGVDYLKYDWCSPLGTIGDQVATFATMRDALAATGRPIVFSINPNSIHTTTGTQGSWRTVANLWRTTHDITDSWDTGNTSHSPMGIKNIFDVDVRLASHAGPGGFNDPDMLEVGRGGLNQTETRSHFALWAMLAAPLIAGNDLRVLNAPTLGVLDNPALIAIDQDPLGLQATEVSHDRTRRVLVKPLDDGDAAVALLNEGATATLIATTARAVGLTGNAFTLHDVWTDVPSRTTGVISAIVPGHGTVVYRVKPLSR